ncbi:di-heme oxidoredictase family protein [Litoribrevibacter albus]|uniref:Thiol oxidoreductase n=1 Tax=Litoribrevibacter albus TaxID=1473156 RepID=A0AA37S787_9GAMM|nr:di-heme oxidoredictase family protein [Litoribrevibacter albus]GLQ29769.1 thiol oxidoreductase [Litoribrevibacter albus]
MSYSKWLVSGTLMALASSVSLADVLDVGAAFDPREVQQGGDNSTTTMTNNAFSKPSTLLKGSQRADFKVGNSFFKNPWVVAPASTDARDGLGSLFNVNACQSCHIKDGRGHAPTDASDRADSMLIRLSILPQSEAHQALLAEGKTPSIAEPNYGGQFQDQAVFGVKPEGRIAVTWTEVQVTFADGEAVSLRKPTFALEDLAYGDLHPDTKMSPRVAPPMIGLGLIEAIDAKDILSQQDVDDKNNDGVSGKANWVVDAQTGDLVLGRFGWKAGQPSLKQQGAGAFNGDMGLTTSLFSSENCTAAQADCLKAPTGSRNGEPEVSDEILDAVAFYSQNLAVPVRRDADQPEVLKGKALFFDAGCQACHTPAYQTSSAKTVDKHLRNQVIFPYTDMLVHDMGDDLSDGGHTEFLAQGNEWRTPPLWGIGMTETVNGHTQFLHDGRARNVMEAVLWHGGEAEQSKQTVLKMTKEQRTQLETFLNSL